VVEDQVTYPLTTAMLAVPRATTVRGYSFFGDSYVYVLFEDGTDLYWARSRVLEYLNQARERLPAGVTPSARARRHRRRLGLPVRPGGRTGSHDLAQLRSLQDWFLKFELQTLPGVSEVATIGGMVRSTRSWSIPDRLRAHGLRLERVAAAIRAANQESGGSVLEMAEAEYMVRATGYLQDPTTCARYCWGG
jgi:copper/silver efflux system protein